MALFQKVRTAIFARFDQPDLVVNGLDACASYTFAAVSLTQLPYSSRNKMHLSAETFVVANKAALSRSFRALNAAVARHLAPPLAQGSRHSSGWAKHAQRIATIFHEHSPRTSAAPYVALNYPALSELEIRVGYVFRAVRSRASSLQEDADFNEDLQAWFRSIRTTAKRLKYAFVRTEMLGASPSKPLYEHIRELEAMLCDDARHVGTSRALRAAASLTWYDPRSSFWKFLHKSILVCVNMGSEALRSTCAALPKCWAGLRCSAALGHVSPKPSGAAAHASRPSPR